MNTSSSDGAALLRLPEVVRPSERPRLESAMLFQEIAEASRAVTATRARSTKIELLAACLSRMTPDEAAIGVGFLSGELRQGKIRTRVRGRPFPRDTGRRRRTEPDAARRRRGARPHRGDPRRSFGEPPHAGPRRAVRARDGARAAVSRAAPRRGAPSGCARGDPPRRHREGRQGERRERAPRRHARGRREARRCRRARKG